MAKIIIIAIVIGFLWQYYNKKKSVIYFSAHERKTIAGTLSFGDVVGWFKTIQGLNQDADTPFIADAQQKDCLKEKMHVVLKEEVTPGKKSILLGVYNQAANKITHSCLVEADDLDEKLKETLGNEFFVVLN